MSFAAVPFSMMRPESHLSSFLGQKASLWDDICFFAVGSFPSAWLALRIPKGRCLLSRSEGPVGLASKVNDRAGLKEPFKEPLLTKPHDPLITEFMGEPSLTDQPCGLGFKGLGD